MTTPIRICCTLALLLYAPGCAGPPARFRIPEASTQLLVVTSASWADTAGRMVLHGRAGGAWQVQGEVTEVVLGRGGLGVGRGLLPADEAASLGGPAKGEGDGRSPAGVFTLGTATGYDETGPRGPRGSARWPFRQATDRLRCVDDGQSPLYNQLTLAPAEGAPSWSSDERMRREDDLYRYTVFVDHNVSPATPGGGSCIFLHVWRDRTSPTSGCTAMAPARIEALLAALDPAAHPLLVQLPADVYRRVAAPWRLPPAGADATP
jgi:D-alanyl-D-alanine dipeptidase